MEHKIWQIESFIKSFILTINNSLESIEFIGISNNLQSTWMEVLAIYMRWLFDLWEKRRYRLGIRAQLSAYAPGAAYVISIHNAVSGYYQIRQHEKVDRAGRISGSRYSHS